MSCPAEHFRPVSQVQYDVIKPRGVDMSLQWVGTLLWTAFVDMSGQVRAM